MLRAPRAFWRRVARWRMGSVRVWLVISTMLALSAVAAGVVGAQLTRGALADTRTELRTRLQPAQRDAERLTTAWLDQEAGQRGFALTGREALLAPYDRGHQRAVELERSLRLLLRDEPRSLELLAEAGAAGRTWRREAAGPEIAAVRSGDVSRAAMTRMILAGEIHFDVLRARLGALSREIDSRSAAELDAFDRNRAAADRATTVAAVLALAALALTAGVLWLVLSRPLNRLLDQLAAVAAGDSTRPIDVGGPNEIRSISAAAETMRVRLVDRSERLGVLAERERLAAELHDVTIQRVFALGLGLSALASSNPEMTRPLAALLTEADDIITELRRLIFALGNEQVGGDVETRVRQLADLSIPVLGVIATVRVTGEVDQVRGGTADELLAVTRKALRDVAGRPEVETVTVAIDVSTDVSTDASTGEETGTDAGRTAGRICLQVTDDGTAVPGSAATDPRMRELRARARMQGGDLTVAHVDAEGTTVGTTVRWWVPLS